MQTRITYNLKNPPPPNPEGALPGDAGQVFLVGGPKRYIQDKE